MLTVIIDARPGLEGLPLLLSQLTAGAVDGLVRQVLIVAGDESGLVDALCEDMGAQTAPTLRGAAAESRSDILMVLPADFRLRDGWIRAIEDHLADGAAAAVVTGLRDGGLFRRAPSGVLVERGRLNAAADGADLQALRRSLGLRPRRVG